MNQKYKTIIKFSFISLCLTIWLVWDISQAKKQHNSVYPSYKMASDYKCMTSNAATVAIVRSDDSNLAHATAIDNANITYETIEEMIRQGIQLIGGLNSVIHAGDMVLLKPNIVDPKPPGSGEVTDVRVIKALIKIIDDLAPGQIEIVVGEGSPRPMDYEMNYQSKFSSPRWEKLWDASGYQDLLTDPYLSGINFRLSNLNGSPPEDPWQDLVEKEVPGGGEADPQKNELGIIKYFIHKDVLNADVFITVPVMKIHDPGITVALKNQIGLAPSTMYGFSKTAGVPQDNYKHRLTHTSQMPKYWTHKEIVDLSTLANIRLAVVDAIMCLDLQKTLGGNNQIRMNTIVVSTDPVAADHVCTRLMCLNPDDIEHITLAEKVGLGTNNPDLINIVGADLDQTKKLFRKNQQPTADFGQSNRIWLLKGPYAIGEEVDPINHEYISDEANITPNAGNDGWSEAVYFRDDHIDLKDYYNLGTGDKVISYCYASFTTLKDQEAELWIGSDEALKIFINGTEVYQYNGNRSFSGNQFVSSKVKVSIKAGKNQLLVKTLQKYGRYDFCLNICEPETNPYYDGNRVWSLKFGTESEYTDVEYTEFNLPNRFRIHHAYPNPFNGTVHVTYEVRERGKLSIAVYNLMGQLIKIIENTDMRTLGIQTATWNGTNDFGEEVATGTYFIKFQSEDREMVSQKVVYLK